ncbi:MAG: signal peptidase I [Holosporales bacterium]|jgi:signal peptidase I|nr:signal peptidase I [Holosporales bacterium]
MKKNKTDWPKEIKSIVGILFVILAFRTLVYEHFQIPSGSMVPSLLVGDMPVVEKWAYGYSKHSILFSPPLFEGRIFKKNPKRGDVIVFKLPTDPSVNYIKRVIGLPGDKIQVIDGVVHINGEPAKLTYQGEYLFEDEELGNRKVRTQMYIEVLPGGEDKPHTIIRHDINNEWAVNNTPVYTVPENHYFMMGDNRDFSKDSRFLGAVGYVHEDLLVGRAVCILHSIANRVRLWEFWRWIQNIRYNRIFKKIV